MACCRARTPCPKSNLSVRRVQRLWRLFGFRDFNPGGVLHTLPYLLDVFSTVHESRDRPTELPAAEEERWRLAMRHPDYKQYINLYNILTQQRQRTFMIDLMMPQPC